MDEWERSSYLLTAARRNLIDNWTVSDMHVLLLLLS